MKCAQQDLTLLITNEIPEDFHRLFEMEPFIVAKIVQGERKAKFIWAFPSRSLSKSPKGLKDSDKNAIEREQRGNFYFLPIVSILDRRSRRDEMSLPGSFALVIWLNENVGFHPSFSRHAKAKASFALVIWLNENVAGTANFWGRMAHFVMYGNKKTPLSDV